MMVETIPLLSDNYSYLVICEQSGCAAVVDPAEAGPIFRRVQELGVDLVAIWNTHHHWDHIGGNEELMAGRDLKLFAHRSIAARIPGVTDPVDDGATVELGSTTARVLHTPGHTTGSITYVLEGAAFTGDTLFGAGCGRLFEGDARMLYGSLHEQLGQLEDATRVYCGHEYTQKNLRFARTLEPDNERLRERIDRVAELRGRGLPSIPSTLGEERQTNPFLRCDSNQILASLGRQFPHERFDQPVQCFAALRRLRDRF